jgi:predicted nuclease with TOPRIM domain
MAEEKETVTEPVEQDEQKIPYSRFKQKVDDFNALKAQFDEINGKLSELETAKRAEEEERLKKQGEFEGLATKYRTEAETLKGQAAEKDQFIQLVSESLAAKAKDLLEKLPKELKPLYPFGEELAGHTLVSAVAWLEKAVATNPGPAPAASGKSPAPAGEKQADLNRLNDAKRRAFLRG